MENVPYTIRYHCGNCGEYFMQIFEFGSIAHQGVCPNCGVNEDDLYRQRIMESKMFKKEIKELEKKDED